MCRQPGADLLAVAGDHVDHSLGHPRGGQLPGELQRTDRGLLVDLEHDSVPGRQRGYHFQIAKASGKFHGTIPAQTPIGSRRAAASSGLPATARGAPDW